MEGAIKNILNNPFLKKALFKQLIKAMKDNEIKLLCITLDESGELQVKEYLQDMSVIPKQDHVKLINKLIQNTQSND